MEVKFLSKDEEKDWQNYVNLNKESYLYHCIQWKGIVEKYRNCKSSYLIAKNNGKISGILPLFLHKSLFFGKSLVNNPFSNYGGVCADNTVIEKLLIEKSKELLKEKNANYLELRQDRIIDNTLVNMINKEHVTFKLDLSRGPEVIWQNLQKKIRNEIRKATKAGIKIDSGTNYLKGFYDVYVENMRDIGAISSSYSLFRDIIKDFSGAVDIIVAKHNNTVIGGLFLFFFKDTVINVWASSLRKYFDMCPNSLLYWNTIESLYKKGYKFFDFGRSQVNTGTFYYKLQWGAKLKQLYYHYYLNRGAKGTMPTVASSRKKLNLAIKIWKKTPVFVTKRISPVLDKHIVL